MREQILKSMKAHALGQIEKHKMNVEIALQNSAMIGEHNDIMESVEKELDLIAQYDDQLEMMNKYFSLEDDAVKQILTEDTDTGC